MHCNGNHLDDNKKRPSIPTHLETDLEWACDKFTANNWSAENFKNKWPSEVDIWARGYSHVILVSVYPVLTAINWAKHEGLKSS